MFNPDLVRSLITTADTPETVEAAYQCLWMAFLHIAQNIAAQTGLHPSYALRRNGTLQTRVVNGYKMPDLIPIRTSRLMDRCTEALPDAAKIGLLQHKSVAFFCKRIPVFEGKKLARTSHKQSIHGVLDVAFTLDPRYPVWAPLLPKTIALGLSAEDEGDMNKAVRAVFAILETVHRNLTACGYAESKETPDVLTNAMVLLRFVIAAYDMGI